jgi:putative acetyltransferase
MIALLAASREAVAACHAVALANGGTCEGPPGLRPQYHPDYYGAYFRDPDGNKLCVCCHDPVVPVTIVPADAPTAEVAALIGELNAEMGALYTAEQQHGLALEAIFQPHIRFFLAWRGGEPVGCGGVGFFDGFAELKRMYVRPRARGQGVADALVARLEAESAAAGHDLLRLETGSRSLAAIRFYRRAGFHPCAAFPPYGSMPPAAIATSVFMEKRLSPPGALPP